MKFCPTSILWIALASTAHAQSTPTDTIDGERDAANATPADAQYESASEAVHKGNLLLKRDNPEAAISAYEQAREMAPDAREVDFVEGLALYAKGDLEQARTAFENATTSTNQGLVDDAIYSVGTTYHAEALQSQQDPKRAIDRLEQAMRRYQTVLANSPDHKAARDANLKAAAKWRTLKQRLEEQEQQQQDGESGETNEQEEQQESNDNQPKQDEDPSEQDQQSSEQQEQSDEQQSEEQQQSDQQKQDEQSQSQQEQEQSKKDQQQEKQEKQDKQQQAQQQQQEESKADAERKLREMMQALRDRSKKKPREVKTIKVVPVEKDW